MIFDDLKNITFYKGIHPNLDQAIDFLYEHRKDSFELGRYDIDGDKVFLVVQENTLNKEESNRFEHHKSCLLYTSKVPFYLFGCFFIKNAVSCQKDEGDKGQRNHRNASC